MGLGPVGAEFNVNPTTGARQEAFVGRADTANSIAYMTLFTGADNDPNKNFNNFFQISRGMRLRWNQFNVAHETISIDFEFTDGTEYGLANERFVVTASVVLP